jgi:uncharacterized membrane protein
MKTQLYSAVLYVHIACGFTALATGLAVIIMKKGTRFHVRTGLIYFWSMAGVLVTTMTMLCLAPEKEHLWFLGAVAVISFYQTYTGRRMVQQKSSGIFARPADWLALGFIAICGAWSLFHAIESEMEGNHFRMTLFLFFAVIGLRAALKDISLYNGKPTSGKTLWFEHHISRMMGSYAATTTAFVVNVIPRHLPDDTHWSVFAALWVLPGVVIGFLGRRIGKKPEQKRRP